MLLVADIAILHIHGERGTRTFCQRLSLLVSFPIIFDIVQRLAKVILRENSGNDIIDCGSVTRVIDTNVLCLNSQTCSKRDKGKNNSFHLFSIWAAKINFFKTLLPPDYSSNHLFIASSPFIVIHRLSTHAIQQQIP